MATRASISPASSFVASQNPNSGLGASVAAIGDVNGDGFDDFIISAPAPNDATGNSNGAGRAYIVFGGPNLSTLTTNQIDLDTPSTYTGINIVTLESAIPGGHLGRSVGSAGSFLGTSGAGLAVAVGAPDAQINSLGGSGVVYVLSDQNGGVLRPASTQTVAINATGQPGGGVPGVQIAGANASDQAGFSVADAGNTSGSSFDDLLIGAPASNVGGAGRGVPALRGHELGLESGLGHHDRHHLREPGPRPDARGRYAQRHAWGSVFVGDSVARRDYGLGRGRGRRFQRRRPRAIS